ADKRSGLAGAGLRAADAIVSGENQRNGAKLIRRRLNVAPCLDTFDNRQGKAQFGKRHGADSPWRFQVASLSFTTPGQPSMFPPAGTCCAENTVLSRRKGGRVTRNWTRRGRIVKALLRIR